MNLNGISIIIPTLNEEGNIVELTERIQRALKKSDIAYEIIFVDDHSSDRTCQIIRELAGRYPVNSFSKVGKKGKAFSLIEGFPRAIFDVIAIIDADLQYPPEAFPEMIEKIRGGCDIVVVNRIMETINPVRRIMSKGFNIFFTKFLHGFDFDVQAGMKVFKKAVLNEVKVNPSGWTFDLEFLLKARFYGYKIGSVDIFFDKRKQGESKINFQKAIYEIGSNAVKLKFKEIPHKTILPRRRFSMIGAGVACNRKRFITHTTLSQDDSAAATFVPWQRNLIISVLVIILAGLAFNVVGTLSVLVAMLSAVYFLDTVFNMYLATKSLKNPPEIRSEKWELDSLDEKDLPIYTVLCPLYKEAHMLPGFVEAIGRIDWPKDKLDVMLLLEETDRPTIASAQDMNLPSYMRIVVVPESLPKTKPKACNYGLSFSKGEFIVIYDAEDIPDPLQLKKAYLGFKKVPRSVGCLQAKLNYFNPDQNLLTKLFTTEYSLWFDMILPGLQSLNTSIPLGGTSNHFRTQDLLDLQGWDPFNVTEDCDLGVRIFKKGYTTAIIDSVTLEEANSDLKNWLRQRSRWIKGYIQTYLVHMRHPLEFLRENGIHALIFQLVVGGKTAFVFINPILWLMTFSYFALNSLVGSSIEKLYPEIVFFMAATSFVFGNFIAIYYYMIGCAKREQWSLIKYVFLVPFYWALMSAASAISLYQLVIKPHFWEKTNHGLSRAKPRLDDLQKASPAMEKPRILPEFPLGTKPVFAEKLAFMEEIHFKSKSIAKEPQVAPEFFFEAEPMLAKKISFNQEISESRPIQPKSKKVRAIWPKLAFPGIVKLFFEQKNIYLMGIMGINVLNFIFNIFLGRELSFENLALVTLISSFWYIFSIFATALSSTVNFQTAYLSASGRKGLSVLFLKYMRSRGTMFSLFVTVVWLSFTPFLSTFFKMSDETAFILFAPAFVFGIIASVNNGYLLGNLHFSSVAAVLISEAVSKLIFALLFVSYGIQNLVFISIPFSIVVSALVSLYIVRSKSAPVYEKKKFSFPKGFFFSSLATSISMMLFFSLDVILVKHYFLERAAGEYVMLSFVGKMIYFFGTLPSVFLIPLVSRNIGQKRGTKNIFSLVYIASFLLAAIGVLGLGIMGAYTVPLIFGPKVMTILPYLKVYSVSVLLLVISNVIVVYNLARKKYIYSLFSMMIPLMMAAGIYLYHNSIQSVVLVIFISSCAGWTMMEIMSAFEGKTKFILNNLKDLIDVFRGGYPKLIPSDFEGKRILVFNWRDMRHEFAGGAEAYIQKISEHWVKKGHKVTIFCGNDSHSPRSERIHGIEIIRRGGFYLVYVWAFIYYIFRFRGKYDVIIDCQNGVPFFAPLYVREPVYCLMHHVHQEVFRISLNKYLSVLACFLEKGLMPLVYDKVPFVTVSESSRREIETLGLGKAGVYVVNPGIELKFLTPGKKSEKPTILYLGRLKAYKSIDILIRAFQLISRKDPDAELVIAGSGEEDRHLKKLVKSLNLNESRVRFTGKISEREKIALLKKSWVLVNPSFMEGWGIVAIEASACGTPVVASDVPGLRDSVRNFETGYLACYGDVKSFSDCIEKIIGDKKLRRRMGIRSRLWAENFEWEKSSASFLTVIMNLQSQRIKKEFAFYKNRIL